MGMQGDEKQVSQHAIGILFGFDICEDDFLSPSNCTFGTATH